MTYPETECFLVEAVGQVPVAGVMWDGQCERTSIHSARERLGEVRPVGQAQRPDIYAVDWVDTACERCGTRLTEGDEIRRFGSVETIYDTPDGTTNHPGAMFFIPHFDEHCYLGWTNCDGQHLQVVLPNLHVWCVDSRASNCGLPTDREHRCWVREGEPPRVSVTENGRTCAAGAGSIASGDYHGFLVAGKLTAG